MTSAFQLTSNRFNASQACCMVSQSDCEPMTTATALLMLNPGAGCGDCRALYDNMQARFAGAPGPAKVPVRLREMLPGVMPIMKVVEVAHPLISHKLGLLREAGRSTKHVRELAAELAALLTYEATRDLETEAGQIEGWAGPVQVRQIKGKKVTIVPILRAGIGMLPGVLDMIPAAKISVVGMQRDETTLMPDTYYEKL